MNREGLKPSTHGLRVRCSIYALTFPHMSVLCQILPKPTSLWIKCCLPLLSLN